MLCRHDLWLLDCNWLWIRACSQSCVASITCNTLCRASKYKPSPLWSNIHITAMSWEILQHFTAYRRDLLTKIFCLQIQKHTEGQILSLHEAVKLNVWGRDETLECVRPWRHTVSCTTCSTKEDTTIFFEGRSAKELKKTWQNGCGFTVEFRLNRNY